MTGNSVTDFTASLIEMAKAHEQLPHVKSKVNELQDELNGALETVQRLELRILDMKNDQDALYKKLREVESERDEVSFRLLESEDKITVVRHLLGSAQAAVGDAVAMVEPRVEVKPEPVPTPEPISNSSSGQEQVSSTSQESTTVTSGPASDSGEIGRDQSGQNPTAAPIQDSTSTTVEGTTASTVDAPLTSGQSETLPTAPSATDESPATIQSASPSPSADSPPQPSSGITGSSAGIGDDEVIHGPYHGTRYYDHAGYVSLHDWLAGGGTEADYHWRPDTTARFSGGMHGY